MSERMFPVLIQRRRPTMLERHMPMTVPWAMLAPHEKQALLNHDQTLEVLASRGGLSSCEMCAILEDRKWRQMSDESADNTLARKVLEWAASEELKP
jgi:hypothetical protein